MTEKQMEKNSLEKETRNACAILNNPASKCELNTR